MVNIFRSKTNNFFIVASAVLVAVVVLAYLLPLSQATIYRDDWYYVIDRMKGGPQTFHAMFAIDRPARGYFFELYYGLFGTDPTPYHLVSFALRLASGLASLQLMRMLWPGRREAVLLMSLLFVLYPGYTHWMEGFENQPSMFSLFLAVGSILLTLQAVSASRLPARIVLWLASILTGLGYLALVDYAIGTEVFRFLCVLLWVRHSLPGLSPSQRGRAALRAWAPAVLITGLYLFWRLFLFDNQRAETDVSLQIGMLFASPLQTGLAWLVNFYRSVLNQAVLAWWSPYFQDFFARRSREIFIYLLLAGAAAACVLAALAWVRRHWERITSFKEAIWIGGLGVAAGVLPVVFANRFVNLGAYSHYALPASLASAVLLGGIICTLPSPRLRGGVAALLVLLAVMNHSAVSAAVLREETAIASFWQQVAWRAPGIRPGTALAIGYPSVNYGEDVDAVNGPANFIYYPGPSEGIPVYYPLYAVKQSGWTAKQLFSEMVTEAGYRTHYGSIDPASMLVISQPAQDTCVHVIDSRYPWYAYNDPDFILLAGRYSKIGRILVEGAPPRLDESIFGHEPGRDWCYYFERAGLAAQVEDWAAVSALAEEAAAQGLKPIERLEWMPFLQAYAVLGDEAAFAQAASRLASAEVGENISAGEAAVIGEYNRRQACSVLESMQHAGWEFSPRMQQQIAESLCW